MNTRWNRDSQRNQGVHAYMSLFSNIYIYIPWAREDGSRVLLNSDKLTAIPFCLIKTLSYNIQGGALKRDPLKHQILNVSLK